MPVRPTEVKMLGQRSIPPCSVSSWEWFTTVHKLETQMHQFPHQYEPFIEKRASRRVLSPASYHQPLK